jgi:predicted MPP superfamily phosphohydrolase
MTRKQISRRSALKILGAGSLGAGLTGLIGYTYTFLIEPHWLSVERIYIPINNLPKTFEDYKLVCLSDFHYEPGDDLGYPGRVVRVTNQLDPDIICLLGDYVFSQADSVNMLAGPLSELDSRDGVFAVLGNHDYWTDPDIVRKGLERAGIELLINQGLVLERDGDLLYLAGLDDVWSGTPEPGRALEDAPAGAPVIMLVHEPDFADHIADLKKVDLQISGHSHGGQIKPFFLDAPVLPAYARKYTAGLYQFDQMSLYVTRGIGVVPPRVRFNCRPEITEIMLTRRPL